MKKAIIAAVLLAAAGRAGAIELSLEENRAERGNIGFVDMQRIFKLFPETLKAKESFEETVRQAEEQVNMRKADILKLRSELEALKTEREAAAKAPPPPPAPVAAAPAPAAPAPAAPAPAAPAPAAPPAAPAVSPAEQTIAQLPGLNAQPGAPAQTPPAKEQPLTINLPGATTGPVVVSPPEGVPAPAAAQTPPPAPAPAAATAPPQPAAVAAPSRLQELDDLLARKTQELERKEKDAREQQATAEKNLLDLESRRSEILLGKIYQAVQDVSRREGISVVVDKSGILYGQSAVDLTEKVLKYLKGS